MGRKINVVFRADAKRIRGGGHVGRCIALAQAVRRAGGEAVFLLPARGNEYLDYVRAAHFPFVIMDFKEGTASDVNATREVAMMWRAKWVVVDGYDFPRQYMNRLYKAKLLVLAIDDLGRGKWPGVQIIVNQSAGPRMYAELLSK